MGGEWTGKTPVCRFVDCGTPVRPDRGNIQLINDSTTVGSVVKYHCDDDYWLVGPAEMSCTKEGKWSGDAPSCECKLTNYSNLYIGYVVVQFKLYNVSLFHGLFSDNM